MKNTNENVKPGDAQDMSKNCCDASCGCHGTSKRGNPRWAIGMIVLVAAGVLVARGVIKANDAAPKAPATGFASLAALTGASANATNSATTEKSLEPIGAISELNTVAAKTDAVLVYLPGKGATPSQAPAAAMKAAAKAIEAQGKKCGLFMLKEESGDYAPLAKKIGCPGVMVLVKTGAMSSVTGEITETKLVQAYVAASSVGACDPAGGSGCCPK